ncbi:MAG: riboflavin synthase [Deltaproteobacteria bacterium]|nr:riboflavin synthase [Deltaproteobacteria bacterium]
MFTGIIEGVGRLVARRTIGGGLAFDLEAGFDLTDPEEGESIAVSGVCLTAYNIVGRRFSVDVSPETLSRSRLGSLGQGSSVNLERALRLSDRLGGHLVSGHVDAMAAVKNRKELGDYTVFSFSLADSLGRYVIEKGSITIDGVSLTVNSCGAGFFTISVIPHTLKVTTLGELKVGTRVNIEVDVIGKYIEKLLLSSSKENNPERSEGINSGFLATHGFI